MTVDDPAMLSQVIALDGPAGSGKSTIAREVAKALGATLLDTGAIYRTLALLAERGAVSWDDEPALADLARALPIRFVWDGDENRVYLEGIDVSQEIRTPEISQGASLVSRHPRVRAALLGLQRGFAEHGLVVAEGRDIGTVVFPDARLKIFLVADLEVRAERRHREHAESGNATSLAAVRAEAHARDQRDAGRAAAPLTRAVDAIELDTSHHSIAEVTAEVIRLYRTRRA